MHTSPLRLLALALICGPALGAREPGYLLPNGWRIRPAWASSALPSRQHLLTHDWDVPPAGVNIPVSTLPMSQALSPDGRFLAVLNAGYSPPSISLVDLRTGQEVSRRPIANAWRGLVYTASGDRLYAGNGDQPSVTEFSVGRDSLKPLRAIPLFTGSEPQVPHLIADARLAGNRLVVADMAGASIAVADLPAGRVRKTFSTAPQPYGLLIAPDGRSVLVSSWSTARVVQYRLEDGAPIAEIRVGAHPTEMAWLDQHRFAVACANTNCVYVAARNGEAWRVAEKINIALTPSQPVGATPSALDVRSDRLYVACSDLNAIAMVDVSTTPSRVLGLIPTGWYPTSVRALPDGRLAVLNGKGLHSFSAAEGTNPWRWNANRSLLENNSTMEKGSVLLVADPDPGQLQTYTDTVRSNSPYRDRLLEHVDVPPGSPIPDRVGGPSPIRHVILVMEEMRTYDQILGDMPEGNGDRSKAIFGEETTPNYHKLAREFALLDNFYSPGEVSKDGFYWTMGGSAPDSTVRTYPIESSHRLPRGRYEEGPEGIRSAPGGLLWDRAEEDHVSFYNYGILTVDLPKPAPAGQLQIMDVRDPVLKPHTSFYFNHANLGHPGGDHLTHDLDRVGLVIRDLQRWTEAGTVPRLILISLGMAHTDGVHPGAYSPFACMADSDQALGLLAEYVSNSRIWGETALFVVYDEAQDGVDHVDSHRSAAYVLSAYSRRRAVDHTFYNSLSVLRTVELILGFQPMTVFDAGAAPMTGLFQSSPDLRPYRREAARISLEERNPPRP